MGALMGQNNPIADQELGIKEEHLLKEPTKALDIQVRFHACVTSWSVWINMVSFWSYDGR